MYNRLLFYCPQLPRDVIFAAVSNQCPQRPPVRESLPTLNVAAEGLFETRKEAFFLEGLKTAEGFHLRKGYRSDNRRFNLTRRLVSYPYKKGTNA